MVQPNPSLGLCFFENQLFYAVNDPKQADSLSRIGSVDFNFDVIDALITGDSDHFPGIRETVNQLMEEYGIEQIRILSLPFTECWTTLPKLVYDNPEERESHINILMQGIPRSRVEPTWYNLSNQDFKFLLLRNRASLGGLEKLAPSASSTDLVSEFEIGQRWIDHTNAGGSFMTVCCFNNCISVGSYLLGKFRGATYIEYEDVEDLPYFWLQYTSELNWMEGLHEQILIYGSQAYHIIDILQPFWDDAAEIIKMDSLPKMEVNAEENTYGFNLELAYPAVMLALG